MILATSTRVSDLSRASGHQPIEDRRRKYRSRSFRGHPLYLESGLTLFGPRNGLLLVGPVFYRELATVPRRPRILYSSRGLCGVIGIADVNCLGGVNRSGSYPNGR